MKKIKSVNPYTGETLKEHLIHSSKAIDTILKKADKQYYIWRKTSFTHRKQLILKVKHLLLENSEIYAQTITEEMGKPITQAIAEIKKCAWLCEYYALNAEKHLTPETIKTDATKSYVVFEPLGVILSVMPWNYPFWQVFRFAIPALMAGNTAVLKHASNVFGCAKLIEEIFKEATFPEGCFSTLLITSIQVEEVIKNPIIKAVTLTGSEKAGAVVAKTAGSQIKKTVLELGGSNALIVLKDCAIEKTVTTSVQARFQNTGQSCIAGKRLLVDESIAEIVVQKLVQQVKNLVKGDPKQPETYIGVLAREDLAIDLEKQVRQSIELGAKIRIGGRREGAYFEPTILTHVTTEMSVFKEETFGPVLSVTTFKTIEEAIQLSNASNYGLGVSVFTKNTDAILPYIPLFEEGAVFINELVKSDPRLPFGGVKQSGYGRELSKEGIREFVNIKTVFIK